MAERSKFTKQTWQLNGEGRSKLIEALSLAGVDCEALGLVGVDDLQPEADPKPKHGDIAKVIEAMGVDRKTAKRLLEKDYGANLKTWQEIFIKNYGDEIDDLSELEFADKYCESAAPKSLYANPEQKMRSQPSEIPHNAVDEDILLMIQIKYRPGNRYIVSAVLAWDENPWSLAAKADREPVRLKGTPHEPISIEQIESVLDGVCKVCSKQYGIDLRKLTVQWFLPIELMSQPVEDFKIRIGRSFFCHWEECRTVMIRSSDRHFSEDYDNVAGRWKGFWKRLSEMKDWDAAKVLSFVTPEDNLKSLCDQGECLGLHFLASTEPERQEDFWDKFLGQGFPIALWHGDSENLNEPCSRISQFISEGSIAQLPEKLTTVRKSSLASSTSNTIGEYSGHRQFSLMWDNPFRPFPDVELTSY